MARSFEMALMARSKLADSSKIPWDDSATRPPAGNLWRDKKGRLVRVKNPPGAQAKGQSSTSPANAGAPIVASGARYGIPLVEALAKRAGL
jgi:hypothetical protein